MRPISVRAPDGRVWEVERRWPRPPWRAWKPDVAPGWDSLDGLGAADSPTGFVVGILIGLVLLAAVSIAIFILLPAIVFVVEIVFVVLALAAARRPWRVRATTLGPPFEEHEWHVRGWRRSKRAVEEVARELEQGVEPAPAAGERVEADV